MVVSVHYHINAFTDNCFMGDTSIRIQLIPPPLNYKFSQLIWTVKTVGFVHKTCLLIYSYSYKNKLDEIGRKYSMH